MHFFRKERAFVNYSNLVTDLMEAKDENIAFDLVSLLKNTEYVSQFDSSKYSLDDLLMLLSPSFIMSVDETHQDIYFDDMVHFLLNIKSIRRRKRIF